MLDGEIVELYWKRDESAISQTDIKYGGLCRSISNNILRNHDESEECVNDSYLSAWNSMPMERPERLGAYMGKIARNISISRLRQKTADKRGGGEYRLCLEELRDCAAKGQEPEKELELKEREANRINRLVKTAGFNGTLDIGYNATLSGKASFRISGGKLTGGIKVGTNTPRRSKTFG